MGFLDYERFLTAYQPPRHSLARGVRAAIADQQRGRSRLVAAGLGTSLSGKQTWQADIEIPAGDKGTEETIRWMARIAVAGSRHPRVIELAHRLVRDTLHKDYRAQADAVLAHLKANVQYVRDPAGLELVQEAPWTLFEGRAADCDDHAVAACALLLALGHPCAFRTVAERRAGLPWSEVLFRKRGFGHVYAAVNIDGRWLGVDSTVVGSHAGWEPPPSAVARKKLWVIQ